MRRSGDLFIAVDARADCEDNPQLPNFYAIAGTVLAALTGVMFARLSPALSGGHHLRHGSS